MYRGVQLDVRIRDYNSARKALVERSSKVRCSADVLDMRIRKEAPLGHPRRNVTGIRLLSDESIACRLYATDVVVWHPDNSVTVESFPTKTTAAFARAVLPHGLVLGGESQLMSFFPGAAQWADWRERWAAEHVCHADGTYRLVDDVWLPDETTLYPLTLRTIDRTITRRLSKEYPFAEFKTWLFAACAHVRVEHQGEDIERCAELIRDRDYRAAAEWLPCIEVPNGFGIRERIKPLRIEGTRYDAPITLGSVDYVRCWVYAEHGAISMSEVTTMPAAEWTRQRALGNQLAKVGFHD